MEHVQVVTNYEARAVSPLVQISPVEIGLLWPEGESVRFYAVTLRDACTCRECVDVSSGQHLFDPAAVEGEVEAASATVQGRELVVVWRPDGHTSHFSLESLRSGFPLAASEALFANCGGPRGGPQPELWTSSIGSSVTRHTYIEVCNSERRLLSFLTDVERHGFALLSALPTDEGSVVRVAELFGYVRETNYGRLFDVRSVADPTNLAYTSLPLGVHTDNPYRDPVPTLQLLHCLAGSVEGGETTLVDGFRVAADLREADLVAFEALTRSSIRFRYEDASTVLMAEVPIISVNGRGEVLAIHFNNRSRQPVSLPPEGAAAYYEAYRTFSRMLSEPRYILELKMEPGDLIIMDNRRVLHGRAGFTAAGKRHLQGCYADVDGLRSTAAVIRRRQRTINGLFRLFHERGEAAYLGEPVSMAEHMLQAAYAAERDKAPPTLVTAALLHDCGHLVHEVGDDAAERGLDTKHEDLGQEILEKSFPPAVTEPVRLHVAAKRYLCATDPAYLGELSPASLLSLELQGGPMTPQEVAAFERGPHFTDAVRLRRYDDAAKVADFATPELEHFRGVLEAALRR